ncbi:Hob2p NDAI_0A04690 [Naumovozyma dairenensis CBS 421]|uniref:Uncharacterized protein n=1 Tax=Naumovozyma dairenensis (strain ATCC 10597 / BCRC 20456 / CBS 421 / NBRC 0211 / NRRL Y-12639) TaxID=1071378 RepID=G0W487_NAUDC|nr:hypothetical protein NDAI_0A04690 [Naumovozyma dairenensis CBS 421]CCD22625.1 hypothetical protein NDAI_0A04690 [Naumovozyma dairenensis CBS 421]
MVELMGPTFWIWTEDTFVFLFFLIIFLITFQQLASLILRYAISKSSIPLDDFSFGLFLGNDIRNIYLASKTFQIRIGKLRFRLGWKPSISLHYVDIRFLNHDNAKHNQFSSKEKHSLRNDETFSFYIGGKILRILKFLLSITVFARRATVTLKDGTQFNVYLSSMSITQSPNEYFKVDLFLHRIINLKTEEKMNLLSYQIKCNIKQTIRIENDKETKISFTEWTSTAKLSGAHFLIPEYIVNTILNKNKNLKVDKSSNVLTEEYIKSFLRSIEYPIAMLTILDIKFENFTLSYKNSIRIDISSIQIYLESVDVLNTGTSLDVISSEKHTGKDYELSFSINTIVLDVHNKFNSRIPLINIILTTNLILAASESIPINQTTISCTTNIINPTFFTTSEHLTDIIKQYIDYLNHQKKPQQPLRVDKVTNNPLSLLDLNSLPNFLFQLTLSNFTSTLKLSNDDNIVFKIFNIQSLLSRNNGILPRTSKDLAPVRKDLTLYKTSSREQNSSNYIKIVGTNMSYLKMSSIPNETSISIPIFEQERSDMFFDEWSVSSIDIQGTLRHSHITLEDITVLNQVSIVFSELHYLLEELRKAKSEMEDVHRPPTSEITIKPKLNWSLKLRFKDTSFSLLVSNVLPKILDPADTDAFNLTSITRGTKIVLHESNLLLTPFEKHFGMSDASLFRIMDNLSNESVSDTILKLSNFSMSTDLNKKTIINLPVIEVKFDTNIIWLSFYISSIASHYLPQSKEVKNKKKNVTELMNNIDIEIGKLFVQLNLPEDVPLLLLIEDITYLSNRNILFIRLISSFVKSVYIKNSKVRVALMTVSDFEVDIKSLLGKEELNISTSLIQFHTEYHFRFYLIVDNFITMFKSFKQLKLAFSSLSEFQRLYPLPETPIKLPTIELTAEAVLIDIEEDPFEQELGLILKVGLLEQRERLQKLKELETRLAKLDNLGKDSSAGHFINRRNLNNVPHYRKKFENNYLQKLLEHFSTSWIARYRKAKLTFQGSKCYIRKNVKLMEEYYLFSSPSSSTTANLVVENLDLRLQKPSFPIDDYMNFLYKYGKGLPSDMLFTLLIVLGINVKTGLWELRLRDYPIPVISLPDTYTTGDVVLAEKMPEVFALNTVYVPFVPSATKESYAKTNSIYGSHIIRTINSVKTYFNLKSNVISSTPASVTWGKSLQPGYESLMMWFDFLTKPKLDPSQKLGFWDKFRFLVHGTWIYELSKQSEFHLNIKGSNDPYKITDDGAGLSFCWSGGTVMRLHDTDDPKEFLKIESKNFRLGVRDFTEANKFEKIYMRLSSQVVWKMGFLFEQGDITEPGIAKRTVPKRPHYDIQLIHPSHVTEIHDYDSYRGFRSAFIHLSFGVFSSGKSAQNCLYLAPNSLSHFMSWWNLFHIFTSGPIRQGPLFPDLIQNKTKFGRALFTIKYQLHLAPMTITHTYRHITAQYDINESNETGYIGLKGRFGSLKIDLHQRRIKLTHQNERLNRSKPVWKLKMSTGEIDCAEADIRIIATTFDKNAVKEIFNIGNYPTILQSLEDSTPIRDTLNLLQESDWYDQDDYVDLNQISSNSSLPLKLEAIPLLYSPRISYFRKINDNGYTVAYPFGGENSHRCLIGQNHPERTQEKLAQQRLNEIETEIEKVQENLAKMADNSSLPSKNKEALKRKKNLNLELKELHHRFHIVHNILKDLKLSEETPDSISASDSSRSSINDLQYIPSEVSGTSVNSCLLRTNTVESFVSMRRASTVQLESTFDNRFIIHNIQLKIDKKIRDHLLEYTTTMQERRSMEYAMTYKSMGILKKVLSNVLNHVKTSVEDPDSMGDDNDISNIEFIEQFEEIIREIPNESFDSVDNYLIRLISPQVQISSPCEPRATIILAARDVEVGIIDIIQVIGNSGKRIALDVDTVAETRYCAVSKDIQLFTLFQDDILLSPINSLHWNNNYGADKNSGKWPPWIPFEMCFDGSLLERHVFLRRRSMFCTLTVPNPLYISDKGITDISTDSKFRMGFPGLILTSTSQQYCAVFAICQDLLSFGSSFDEKVEKLSKILFAEEVRNNLDKFDASIVTNLQNNVRDLYYTRSFLKINDDRLFHRNSQRLNFEIQTNVLKLALLMTAIKKIMIWLISWKRVPQKKLRWLVGTDDLVWELYNEKTQPFITISLGSSTFSRSQNSAGFNSNSITISSLRCFNQQRDPAYVELIVPFESHIEYDKDIPLVQIFWAQGPPIGGISNLEKMVVSLQPIVFKMDHVTSEKLMNYLFPKIDSNVEIPESYILGNEDSVSPIISRNGSYTKLSPALASAKQMRDVDSWDLSSIHNLSNSPTPNSPTLVRKEPTRIPSSIFSKESIDEMVKRSSVYFNVGEITIKRTTMSVCYKGAHKLLTDVNDLIVNVPVLEYYNKLWSRDEFFAALKKDVIKIVLQHLGRIIGNKFIPHKKENKLKISMDISRILKSDAESEEKHLRDKRYPSSFESRPSISSSRKSNSHQLDSVEEDKDEDDIKPFYPSDT